MALTGYKTQHWQWLVHEVAPGQVIPPGRQREKALNLKMEEGEQAAFIAKWTKDFQGRTSEYFGPKVIIKNVTP